MEHAQTKMLTQRNLDPAREHNFLCVHRENKHESSIKGLIEFLSQQLAPLSTLIKSLFDRL